MEYIAHFNEETKAVQSVKEHNENVAAMCKESAIAELKEMCFAIGLLHDIGKYGLDFQKRINGENIRVDHSTAGAVVMQKQYGLTPSIIGALSIAGHHAGIPDMGIPTDCEREDISTNLYTRIAQKQKRCESGSGENFDVYKDELDLPYIDEERLVNFIMKDCKTQEELIDKLAFVTRYCFSCLVDADSIDTGIFCGTRTEDKLKADFYQCLEKVNERLDKFVCKTELQMARRGLQEQAFSKANQDADIYLMNMPTGSGKTLCSIKFALQRATATNKKRIIYVIPYNNIIDQTAIEFEELFQDCAQILRHQSSYSYEETEDINEDYRNALKNGTENWDADSIILTTAVQFFESIHSNRRGKLRKIHNIADSILVFDEAHLMPTEYLQPCLQAVSYATKYLNSEALFLTATMPDFETLLCRYTLTNGKILNLIEDKSNFKSFEKCEFKNIGDVSSEGLLERITESASVLVVTNTKNSARRLFNLASGKKYYLSTYLTAKDRKSLIKNIKTELKNLDNEFTGLHNVPEERKIKVFSTSLIEAGVDLDFETVYRERSGLDSILQSGGRCNREGKRHNATTYIFSFSDEDIRTKPTDANELAKGMFDKYENISDSDCIKEYYQRLLGMNNDKIEGKTISKFCNERGLGFRSIPFSSYAEKFHIIDDRTESIVVPQDEESRKIIEAIKYENYVNTRKLQKFTCSISKKELEELIKQHAVDDYGRGIWCLTNENYYDDKTGIQIELTDYFL